MTNENRNPFLFVCGVPRSGTTLLQRMLNSHPQLAVANDTHFIPRALELTSKHLIADAVNSVAIPLTAKLANNVIGYHRFYRTGISHYDFGSIIGNATTYQELVAGVFNQIAKQSGKLLAGEKTPDYLRRLQLLNGMFPQAKKVHIVRDGRNVALSLMQWATPSKGPGKIELWKENSFAVSALWWKWMIEDGLQQASQLDRSVYQQIKYEELTSNPEESLIALCCFLQLPFDKAMLEFNKGKETDSAGLSAKSAWRGPTTGLRDWQKDIRPTEVALFEALAGDTLLRCGYSLSGIEISSDTKHAAEKYQAWWQEKFLNKTQNDALEIEESNPVANQ